MEQETEARAVVMVLVAQNFVPSSTSVTQHSSDIQPTIERRDSRSANTTYSRSLLSPQKETHTQLKTTEECELSLNA